MFWLFLAAYTCSGLAGLVYEVTWTRLLTLQLGHTTAAASTVVGAFLLGLALGAAAGGRWAQTRTRVQAVRAYGLLELAVAGAALVLPWQIQALTPLFRWAYQDGAGGALFAVVRVVSCLPMVMLPAVALGATFPLAVRWFSSDGRGGQTRRSAVLYATNTAGAAVGAVLAGFVLIPSLGVARSTYVGMAASIASGLVALLLAARGDVDSTPAPAPVHARTRGRARHTPAATLAPPADRLWLTAAVLGLSGFAALLHEIAWTRILALVLGPTTYAFAATLAAVITGAAAGAWIGAWIVSRAARPATWLALALAAAAITASVTYSLAGREVPLLVAQHLAALPPGSDDWIARGAWITAALIVPTSLCLGAAFPLALAVAGASAADVTGRVAVVYAVNTVGAVSGSLAAGFLMIPRFGLQVTLQAVSGCLAAAALVVVARAGMSRAGQVTGGMAAALAVAAVVASPPWDRELLASGAYLYAPFVPKDLDLEALLKAGTLRYYAEGAAATVSVKTLTGTTTLTVDGKTDASNRGDMLTQSLVAHLPLLLHDAPRDVAIVGLGSGVTVGAALTHPVTRVDVVELSPEVVAASRFFARENRDALADPRTHLIVGDGRSHLHLTRQRYDVIISEPSNPWIAGVAALFTREFFAEVRERLAPGGVFCQWANAYNIGDGDLRAITATFLAEFPNATAVLVGEHDLLLVGKTPLKAGSGMWPDPWDAVARNWTRPGVTEDLRRDGARSPFALLSLIVAGAAELADFGRDRVLLDDDHMQLEFSAPREIHRRTGAANGATLRALLGDDGGPPARRAAIAAA
ncbi:MAG: fused MFS/spermidine synthase, partial [Acidobacteriota bacterium]